MKYSLLILIIVLFTGCEQQEKIPTEAYTEFVAKYNSDERYFCDEAGFLEHEYIMSHYPTSSRDIVQNNAGIPTRCNVNDISIKVKETVATGYLPGGIQ